jgi:hypothetical protein
VSDLTTILEDVARSYQPPNEDNIITCQFFESADDVPGPKNMDKSRKNLMIFDDLQLEKQGKCESYCVRGRHSNVDCFYLAQNYFKLPRQSIREKANFICLFPQDRKHITHIYNDHASTDMSLDEFKYFCKWVWEIPHGFLVIDLSSNKFRGKYRCGLDLFYIPLALVPLTVFAAACRQASELIFNQLNDSAIFTTNTSSSIGITMVQINNVFLRRDGTNNVTGELNMNGHKVVNIATQSASGDAASKSYVDSTTVTKTEDTMTGNLIMQVGNNPSISLGCNDLRGTSSSGCIPKTFNILGSTADMIQHQVGQPITMQSSDGIVLWVADNELARFYESTITFQRDVDMNEGLISNLRSPENDNDAANKKYVDSLIGSSAPNITSTPTMTNNSTIINGLTYVASASSMGGGQTRACRAFTNEVELLAHL